MVVVVGIFIGLGLTGSLRSCHLEMEAGFFSSFRGYPCRLQKNTDKGWGEPIFLVIDGGDPRMLLLAGGLAGQDFCPGGLGGGGQDQSGVGGVGHLLREGGSPNRTLLAW